MNVNRRSFLRRKAAQLQPLPWLKQPERFTDDCNRCHLCLQACPINLIQIGDGGFPHLDFHQGGCQFCYACANACPLPLFTAQTEHIWSQHIAITERCLSHQLIECRSCADNCEHEAISFALQAGRVASPLIQPERCTGCGECIHACPVTALVMESS